LSQKTINSSFDFVTSAIVAVFAIVTWNMVTAWDALIDKLILSMIPFDPEALVSLLIVAIITTIIAVVVMYSLRKNVSDIIGISIIEEH